MPSNTVLEPKSTRRVAPDGLSVTIERLNALGPVEEEDDFLPPCDYALATACALLNGASAQMRAPFPSGSPSADGSGGIRIEWQHSDKEIRLVIAAKPGGRSYIYHEEDTVYATEPSVSQETLAVWLSWLVAE